MGRPKLPEAVATEVLVLSRRRCALCFGLNNSHAIVRGQLAHLDGNAANNVLDNLAWLCLEHHDLFDSKTSQSKGFTVPELRHYRDDLYSYNSRARTAIEPGTSYARLTELGAALAKLISERSQTGRILDPQIRIAELPDLLQIQTDDVELAIDELEELGLTRKNGAHEVVYPTNRFFWETDPLFCEHDPTADAQELARMIVGLREDDVKLPELATRTGWAARRLNPASTYLAGAGLVGENLALGAAPFALWSLRRTPRTRRFVRDLE